MINADIETDVGNTIEKSTCNSKMVLLFSNEMNVQYVKELLHNDWHNKSMYKYCVLSMAR